GSRGLSPSSFFIEPEFPLEGETPSSRNSNDFVRLYFMTTMYTIVTKWAKFSTYLNQIFLE
ncbi:MAG: hypothetical protein KAS17_09745, partial [Victivallaceae bacterium]|nr:hypothetical protein [Victivallaceae bacterium]